jgi:hypothetical protein
MCVTTRASLVALVLFGGVLTFGALGSAADESPAAGPAGRIVLKDVDVTGDRNTEDELFQFSFSLTGKAGGQEVPLGEFSVIKKVKFLDDTLALSERGPSISRRKYTLSRELRTRPGGSVKKVASYEGKTVTFKRFGDKRVVLVDKGKLSTAERTDLTGELDDSVGDPYPDHPVGPGDEWDIDPKQAEKLFGQKDADGTDVPKGHFKFLDYATYDGQKCARMAMTLSFHGAFGPGDMDMELTGTCYYAVGLQHTLLMSLAGPLKLQGKKKEGAGELETGGTGKASVRIAYHYLKKAGKPVKALVTPVPQK